MNPFDRLRKVIDKVDINYVTPETIPVDETDQPASTQQWPEKQTKYVEEINRLCLKIQRLQKANKKAQIQNQELIKQICQLEKNNELLEAKVDELGRALYSADEKQKKFKEQIHRINTTINQLGSELTHERTQKKNTQNQLQKLKETLRTIEHEFQSEKNSLKEKIELLKEEIEERTHMLEFNIKKSADERRQIKLTYQSKLTKLQALNQQLTRENSLHREKICTIQGEVNLQKQKSQSQQQKIISLTGSLELLEGKLKELSDECNCLNERLNQEHHKLSLVERAKEDLQAELEFEKENVKVKVIELRDETLELELEMYKKQCKELLQEKAILSRV